MVLQKVTQCCISCWRVVCEGAWGLLAGAIGSLCCIGPSAAILLGLGSSSALFGFQVNHTLALAGGGVVLGLGLLFARWRRRTCDLRPQARWRRIVLMLSAGALVYGLLGLFAPWVAARQEQVITEQIAAAPVAILPRFTTTAPTLRRATLLVAKMDCPPCVSHLRGLLARKPAVARFAADLGNEEVSVVYDSRQIDAATLLALIPQPYQAALRDDVPLP